MANYRERKLYDCPNCGTATYGGWLERGPNRPYTADRWCLFCATAVEATEARASAAGPPAPSVGRPPASGGTRPTAG